MLKIDQKEAFRQTLELAALHGMDMIAFDELELSFQHLQDMYTRILHGKADFDGEKLGRYLGWAQCAVVAAGIGVTLQDMIDLNKRLQIHEQRQ